jgi:FMN phosphatase YigB (HAD superfamily)
MATRQTQGAYTPTNFVLCENLLPLDPSKTPFLLVDLWKTLARGPYPEPIEDLQFILGYEPDLDSLTEPLPLHIQGVCRQHVTCESGGQALPSLSEKVCRERKLDYAFLRKCLTMRERDPDKFIHELAQHFSLSVPEGAVETFKQALENEKNGLCYYADVPRELWRLKKLGFKIALFSNVWGFPLENVLADLNYGHKGELFEHVIVSCDVGIAKPDRGIFIAAAESFNARFDQCVVVGDNPALDIRGALNVGMKAVHIDRYGDCADLVPGVPVIRKLAELVPAAAA